MASKQPTPSFPAYPALLAAYVLGHDSRILRRYQDLYSELRWEGTERGVPIVLDGIRQASSDLGDEIDEGTRRKLNAVLQRIVEVNGRVPECPPAAEAPGFQEWQELLGVIGGALAGNASLRQWVELGATLGQLELDAGATADEVGVTMPFDRFRSFTHLVQALPKPCVAAIPILQEWLRLTRVPPVRMVAFLYQLGLGPPPRPPETEPLPCPEPSAFDACRIMEALRVLDERIQRELRNATPSPYLGLVFEEDNVVRPGSEPLNLGGRRKLHALLKELHARGSEYSNREQLLRKVWDEHATLPSLYEATKRLNKLLRDLGLVIASGKNQDCRLQALPDQP